MVIYPDNRYMTLRPLGKSVHSRVTARATITDPQTPESKKRRAFIIGGTHGAETASIYGVEGMLNFLLQ